MLDATLDGADWHRNLEITIMKIQIERAKDINPVLFDLLHCIRITASNLDQAEMLFNEEFKCDHPLYWLYRGGNHLAVHSHNHEQRLAIIIV